MKREQDIHLGLSMNTGLKDVDSADITQEEKNIAINSGRDIDAKEKSDSTISGIANYRVLSAGQ